jgi:hypothetical protein
MQGIFSLKTAADLRDKLRRDLERLKAEPLSADAAFNFFVTAEHMLDWVYPGRAKSHTRAGVRKSSPLLRTCSHLANGGKHFEVEDPQHESVSSTDEGGSWDPPGWYPPHWHPPGWYPQGRLLVNLKGEAATQLGPSIGAIELAEKVMEYWAGKDLIA